MTSMGGASDRASTLEADWLGASRRAAAALGKILHARPSTAERAVETGDVGDGGDRTLQIDADAEQAVFDELDRLHDEGARFTAVSEERGVVEYGDPGVIAIIDPIDGSINAKRGIPHHAISIAVAEGPTMRDVVFGFIHDYGPGEEWSARRGGGAFLDGVALPTEARERRTGDGKLEVLGIESAEPHWVREAADALAEVTYRVRALGTIAATLCQVAGARMDGMVTLARCRAVDAAAGQLIVREAGGHVAFTSYEDPLGAPLDTEPRSPVIAARTPEGLAQLRAVPKE